MKLALYLPNFRDEVTVKELEDLTQLAEDLDFDSVWTLDRIVVPEASDREELVNSFGMMEGFPKALPVSARGQWLQGYPLIPWLAATSSGVLAYLLGDFVARRTYARAYSSAASGGGARRYRRDVIAGAVGVLAKPVGRASALFVSKDMRVFLRDPQHRAVHGVPVAQAPPARVVVLAELSGSQRCREGPHRARPRRRDRPGLPGAGRAGHRVTSPAHDDGHP